MLSFLSAASNVCCLFSLLITSHSARLLFTVYTWLLQSRGFEYQPYTNDPQICQSQIVLLNPLCLGPGLCLGHDPDMSLLLQESQEDALRP